MEEKWYYASFVALNESGEVNFDIDVEGSYFPTENDDTAIAYAKEWAENGEDYDDIGHVDLELVSVCEVDPNNDWEEVRTIWF